MSSKEFSDQEDLADVKKASDLLTEARQQLGLSQKEVGDKLFLAQSLIEHIDEGRYSSIPKKAFIRGYLRNYARIVGASGEKVVMTNGCFDILHKGHVDYLSRARALGHRLIVAVNDDASVAALKGPARPINPLDARMEMLAALRCVDWVVSFSSDTPADLIAAIAPDVLVKGGDYRPEEIAGAYAVLANGGRVEVLSFVEGFSTTALIEALQR